MSAHLRLFVISGTHSFGHLANITIRIFGKVSAQMIFWVKPEKRLADRWPWTACDVQRVDMWMDPNDAGLMGEQHTERRKKVAAHWPQDSFFEHLGESGTIDQPSAGV